MVMAFPEYKKDFQGLFNMIIDGKFS